MGKKVSNSSDKGVSKDGSEKKFRAGVFFLSCVTIGAGTIISGPITAAAVASKVCFTLGGSVISTLVADTYFSRQQLVTQTVSPAAPQSGRPDGVPVASVAPGSQPTGNSSSPTDHNTVKQRLHKKETECNVSFFANTTKSTEPDSGCNPHQIPPC